MTIKIRYINKGQLPRNADAIGIGRMIAIKHRLHLSERLICVGLTLIWLFENDICI